MARAQHESIVRQGRLAIAAWREKYPSQQLDLSGTDLSGLDLAGALLAGSDLRQANLASTRLAGADLARTDLRSAMLEEAELAGASLCRADLRDAELCSADLRDANLTKADLGNASLPCAGLAGSVLLNADLSESNLEEADLRGADLTFANLRGANLQSASFHECRMWNTVLAFVDLGSALGLAAVRHYGPSEIGVATLYRSGDALPKGFLRGAGVPDDLIDRLPELTAGAASYRSCFLSYSEADDELARTLYNDLVREHVPVWRWREDARVGDRLISSIDRAIRQHDKVIVVLSESSLASPAVGREIERALFEEDDRGRLGEDPEVLVPIRVDDAVFDWPHDRQRDVLAKHVGDFRGWQDPTVYRAAFRELLAALRDAPVPLEAAGVPQ